MDISWGKEAAVTWGRLSTVSPYFPNQFVKQLCEAIRAIRAFLQPCCRYSIVNAITPQFITLLTGFRPPPQKKSYSGSSSRYLMTTIKQFLLCAQSFPLFRFKGVIQNYKYTALILITLSFRRWNIAACWNTHLGVLSSQSQRGLLSPRCKEKWQRNVIYRRSLQLN